MQGVRNNRWLHRFAVVTAGATFLLIIAGALVTSNEAGLAVPDWPLSYGTWWPPMVGNIRYEHGHRMVAIFVGLLTTVLAFWLWRRESRRWLRRLGWMALAAVVTQGVLGGITVLYLLPTPVSVGHACLAQLFFCLMVSIAVVTGEDWFRKAPKGEDSASPSLAHLSLAAALVVFIQLALGAAYRHSGLSLHPHLAGAVLVTAAVAWTAARVFRFHAGEPSLVRPAVVLVFLALLQIFLGVSALLSRLATREEVQPHPAMVTLTVAHVAVGALVLASYVVLTLEAYRHLARSGGEVQVSSELEKAPTS